MNVGELLGRYKRGERDFRFADLAWADLRGANLGGADLLGADLRGADLREANLSGARLDDAILRDADLGGANLSHARLMWANLCGANLHGVDLSTANLYDVLMPDETRHWYWEEHHVEMSDVEALQAGVDVRCSRCGRWVRPDDPAWLPSHRGGVQCGACVTGLDVGPGMDDAGPSEDEAAGRPTG